MYLGIRRQPNGMVKNREWENLEASQFASFLNGLVNVISRPLARTLLKKTLWNSPVYFFFSSEKWVSWIVTILSISGGVSKLSWYAIGRWREMISQFNMNYFENIMMRGLTGNSNNRFANCNFSRMIHQKHWRITHSNLKI